MNAKVKIIASVPDSNQEGIEKLIGQTFDVLDDFGYKLGEDSIQVQCPDPDFDGPIIVHPGEYEVVP